MDYIALGCMSGTSLDGIDLSLIRSDGDTYSEEIMNYFQPYSKDLKNKLHEVIQRGYLTDPKITTQLSIEYSRTIQQFLDSNKKYEVNVIGIHGQTLFHDEKTKISIQLFDKNLNLNMAIPVICNFRKNDLLNGGFGAPIIPIYHQLIHQKLNKKCSVFVNIGGVTNITIINQEGIFAGDTSFGNELLNYLIKNKFNFDMVYDGYISVQVLVN
jgi:anhydro-N-acetylmuramic acid kinase